MPSHTNTESTVKYDSGSSNVYNQLQPQINSNLAADMNPDITKNPTYQLMLAKSLGAANSISGRNIQNFYGNQLASGMNPSSGYVQSGLDKLSRNSGALQANAFITNLLAADDRRRNATAQAQGYRPLQTGQATTQSTSGLGTWLPQVASAGLGLAGGFIGSGGGSSGALTVTPEATPNGTGQFGNFAGGMGSFGMSGNATLPTFAGVSQPALYNPSYFSDGHGPY